MTSAPDAENKYILLLEQKRLSENKNTGKKTKQMAKYAIQRDL